MRLPISPPLRFAISRMAALCPENDLQDNYTNNYKYWAAGSGVF